jgi:26S proteasome regulatory subunit T1
MSKAPDNKEDDEGGPTADETDLNLLSSYSRAPFSQEISAVDKSIDELKKHIESIKGGRENLYGLLPPGVWNVETAQKAVAHPFEYVGHCIKILPPPTEPGQSQLYIVSFVYHKYVVKGSQTLNPGDVSEGCRVGLQHRDFDITQVLQHAVDPLVAAMQLEERPDVTYQDVGGCKEQLLRLKEVIEDPMLHPERFEKLGIDPPKGVLFYGPPGTGKTLVARAVANRTNSDFIRIIGSELVKKYIGEGAKMVRDIFKVAKSKSSCIVFFDEVDAFGQNRGGDSDGDGANSEVQRTMLELISQLDGFDQRGTVKVIMATNRPDTLDPALKRPGRLDRHIEFSLPDLDGRVQIFRIHTKTMNVERGIRFELLARMCPNATGADLRSVCTEAGIIALRARRKTISEKDFLGAVNKVIKGYSKFSATPSYMSYN